MTSSEILAPCVAAPQQVWPPGIILAEAETIKQLRNSGAELHREAKRAKALACCDAQAGCIFFGAEAA